MLDFSAGVCSLDQCDFWTFLSCGSRNSGRFFFFCDLSMYGHNRFICRGQVSRYHRDESVTGKKLWAAAVVVVEKLALDFCLTAVGWEDA